MKHLGIHIIDKKTLREIADKQIELEKNLNPIVEQVPELQTDENGNFTVGSVVFRLMADGTVDITCDWIEDIPQLGQVYALMCEMINDGYYMKEMEKSIMLNSDVTFIDECLEFWKEMQEEPIIQPHEVFQNE